jgi:hypothetical protein
MRRGGIGLVGRGLGWDERDGAVIWRAEGVGVVKYLLFPLEHESNQSIQELIKR